MDYNVPTAVREHETINKKTQENEFKGDLGPDIRASPHILEKVAVSRNDNVAVVF